MKYVLIALLLFAIREFAFAGNVKGYVKSNGTYVQPYVRPSSAMPVYKPIKIK